MERFNVSQLIVDRTVVKFRTAGLLRVVPGRGTFVTEEVGRLNTEIPSPFLFAVPRWNSSDLTLMERHLASVREKYLPTRILVHSYDYSERVPARLPLEGERLIVEYGGENLYALDGREVSQVYVGESAPLVYRPKKELKGFSKDLIGAGKSVKVRVGLDFRAFAHWNTARDTWEMTDGVYEVFVGASSADIRLTARLRVENGKFVL